MVGVPKNPREMRMFLGDGAVELDTNLDARPQ
jgi:hypothetical protein